MSRFRRVEQCRICGSKELLPVLDLGEQFLTGFSRALGTTSITAGPLQLIKCCGESACGLLQLAHSYDLAEMYGQNYGYRSGLNPSMVSHLHGKVRRIMASCIAHCRRLGPGYRQQRQHYVAGISARRPSTGRDGSECRLSSASFYPQHIAPLRRLLLSCAFQAKLPWTQSTDRHIFRDVLRSRSTYGVHAAGV